MHIKWYPSLFLMFTHWLHGLYIHLSAMHTCHNICTVHWLERPPPKVVYQPNCECGPPFMTKEMLYGIVLPLDVPLPHALWMMPHK